MKRLFAMAGLLAALLTASCSNNTYTIGGTVEDPSLEGSKVYKIDRYDSAALLDGTAEQKMDSTVVAGGKFQFVGEIDSPDYCTIYIPSGDMQNGPFLYRAVVIEPGVTVSVVNDADHNTIVSGSELNDALQAYEEKHLVLEEKLMELINRQRNPEVVLSDAERAALDQELEKAREVYFCDEYEFVKANINNPGAWSKLYNSAVMAGSLEKQKELIAGASGKTLELGDYKQIVERIEKLEKTAVGQKFTDLAFEDPDGNMMHLSDYAGKGKYILVDFWASWCGPCKAEMPNVVKCYHQYKDKGFDIVSISLDRKKENWVKAIDEWGMPWHHMSDLKGWDCEGAKVYAVTGVPHAMLLGPDGTILARGLYGEELYAKLAEVMP
ncbi:MAG: AhpC/TSA family protein [Bacteroidales bacterium]|nr:AhpC/TSA family protein [Bacteroidales bacterium]